MDFLNVTGSASPAKFEFVDGSGHPEDAGLQCPVDNAVSDEDESTNPACAGFVGDADTFSHVFARGDEFGEVEREAREPHDVEHHEFGKGETAEVRDVVENKRDIE